MNEDLGGFGLTDKNGLKDFWTIYDANYDKIQKDLLVLVEKLPCLSVVLKQMTPEQLEAQSQRSRELMRKAIFNNEWQPLVDQQRQDGAAYASMGVAFREWFELVGAFQRQLAPLIVSTYYKEPERIVTALQAMSSYLDMAMSVIGEEYLKTKERIISQQQSAIQELSTPVLQVRERLLLIPIIGLLDSYRARHLTEQLLHSIRTHRAKVVVIDITGVSAVDSKVASHLFQMAAAARLMGAKTVITGLSALVAQALVSLGVDFEKLNTVGDLQGGLEEAEKLLGLKMVQISLESNPQKPM